MRRRSALPPWKRYEDFCRHVDVPRGYVLFAAGLGLLAVLIGNSLVTGWSADSGIDKGATAVVIAALVCGAAFVYARGRRKREARLREIHARALARAVEVHAFSTRFKVTAGDGYGKTVLLVDHALPAPEAQRIYAAARNWLGRLETDDRADEAARKLFGGRWVVPLSEVFGPEAGGVWLARDLASEPSPWRLLLLDPDDPDLFDTEAILPIRRQQDMLPIPKR